MDTHIECMHECILAHTLYQSNNYIQLLILCSNFSESPEAMRTDKH